MKRIFTVLALGALAWGALIFAPPPAGADIHIALQVASPPVLPDSPFEVDLVVTQAGTTFNAYDAVIGWDSSCTATRRSAARIVDDQLRTERSLLPGMDVIVWNDMFDPHHNAVPDYYLVNGDLTGSWEGLDPSVTVLNWNGEHRRESLRFFAARGNPQVIAGYYDGKPDDIADALRAAEDVPGIKAVMYTTWKERYGDLEAFAHAVMKAGWR